MFVLEEVGFLQAAEGRPEELLLVRRGHEVVEVVVGEVVDVFNFYLARLQLFWRVGEAFVLVGAGQQEVLVQDFYFLGWLLVDVPGQLRALLRGHGDP